MRPVGARSERFCERPQIIGAQRAVDVWASFEWHRRLGCSGVPTLPWLDEKDQMVMRLIRTGRRRNDVEMYVGSPEQRDRVKAGASVVRVEASLPGSVGLGGKLSPAHALALSVGETIVEFGNPPCLAGLLLHRYPRLGPYERTEAQASYRKFRPAHLGPLLGNLRSRYMEYRLDEVFGQIERDFLSELSLRGIRRGGQEQG